MDPNLNLIRAGVIDALGLAMRALAQTYPEAALDGAYRDAVWLVSETLNAILNGEAGHLDILGKSRRIEERAGAGVCGPANLVTVHACHAAHCLLAAMLHFGAAEEAHRDNDEAEAAKAERLAFESLILAAGKVGHASLLACTHKL